MISLVSAYQDYKNDDTLLYYWYKKIDDFIFEQKYNLEDYAIFCQEAQDIYPVNNAISRQQFLSDITVKTVPFSRDEVYYALCTIPNIKIINSNINFTVPVISCAFMNRDNYAYEIPAVTFFKDMTEVRKYYRDIIRLGEIVFFVMSRFFFVFKEVTTLNIRKFKLIAQHERNSHCRYNMFSNIVLSVDVFNEHSVIEKYPEHKLPNPDISKIMLQCLKHYQRSAKFLGRYR